jgi:hypothetical protein
MRFRHAALFCAAILPLWLGASAQAQRLLGNELDLGRIFDVDPVTGAATNPRNSGIVSLNGIASGPGGTLYGLSSFISPASPNSLYRIDPRTGAATLVGRTGLSRIVEGDLTFDPRSGFLYGLANEVLPSQKGELFRIDPTTGAATVVGILDPPFSEDPSAMAFGPDGTLYVLDLASFGGRLLTVDRDTAAVLNEVVLQHPVTEFLGRQAGMSFDPQSGVFYVATGGLAATDGTRSLYTLDVSSGALTMVGPTGLDRGLAGLTFVVPEPTLVSPLVLLSVVLARVRPLPTSRRR